jgi:nicotinamidase-related amidase
MKTPLIALTIGSLVLATTASYAASIVDEWGSIKLGEAPQLKPVQIDPKTTALLMLDFMNQNCAKRQRCIATIPAVKRLLAAARAAKVLVVYSVIANTTPADIMKEVAPEAGDPSVGGSPDKFLRTDLENILMKTGIQTVIPVGTSSNGAILLTAAGAAFRGMNVVVPVDAISAAEAIAEYTAVVDFETAPVLSTKTTLTKIDMINFR